MSQDTEYASLREEILQLSARQFNTTTFAITATVLLIGYGIESDNNKSLILIVPLIILAFAGFQMVSQAYATMRIATYIYCFIEPRNENYNWETYMRAYRAEVTHDPIFSRLSWPSYQTLLVAVGWFCVILSIVFASQTAEILILPIIASLLWLWFTIWFIPKMKKAVSGDIDTQLTKVWEKIAANVKNQDAPAADLD